MLEWSVTFDEWIYGGPTWQFEQALNVPDSIQEVPGEPASILPVIQLYYPNLFTSLIPFAFSQGSKIASFFTAQSNNISSPMLFRYGLDSPGIISAVWFEGDNESTIGFVFDQNNPALCNVSAPSTGPVISGLDISLETFCQIMGWIFGVCSSLTLYDLGSVYDPGFPSDNQTNIFANDTAYQNYMNFSVNVLGHLVGAMPFDGPSSLDEENQLHDVPTSLSLTYSCSQRQVKGWLSLFISVLAADVALIIGAYNFFIMVAGYIQKKRDKRKDRESL